MGCRYNAQKLGVSHRGEAMKRAVLGDWNCPVLRTFRGEVVRRGGTDVNTKARGASQVTAT